jgi:hypothetical protein
MLSFSKFILENSEYTIEPSQGDGFVIKTAHGKIDYRPTKDGTNEIWWVESNRKGHGSELVSLMQKHHPADSISWGVTSKSGEALRRKWHGQNPKITSIHGYPHEGQFDPYE